MKKLLLILSAIIYIALSPHPLSAQLILKEETFSTSQKYQYYQQTDNDGNVLTNPAWEDVTAPMATIAKRKQTLEKVRIGDIIIEIETTNTPNFGLQREKDLGLGLYVGSKFRIYFAPESEYAEKKIYKAKFSTNRDNVGYYSIYTYKITANLNAVCSQNAKQTNIGSSFSGSISYPNAQNITAKTDKPTYSFEINSTDGLSNESNTWLTLTAPSAATDLWSTVSNNSNTSLTNFSNGLSGINPLIYFSTIIVSIESDELPVPAPATVTIPTTGQNCAIKNGDAYEFNGTTTITPTAGSNDFQSHEIYYIISDKQLSDEEFVKGNATKLSANQPISVNKECVVNIRVYGIHNSLGESAGAVQSFKFVPIPVKAISELSEIQNEDGKIVQLNFVTKAIASALTAGSSSANGYHRIAYLRDGDGNTLKVVSKKTTSHNLPACIPASINGASENLTNASNKYTPAGSIIGVAKMENGHPVVYIADQISSDKFDYSAYCGTTTSTATELNIDAADFTALKKVSEVTADLWGDYVSVEGLTGWNGTNKILIDKMGEGKSVDIALSSDIRALSNYNPRTNATLNTATAENIFIVNGIVEYDADKETYILIAGEVLAVPAKPNIAITSSATHSGELNDGIDVAVDVARLSGTMTFTFNKQNQPSLISAFSFYIYDLNNNNRLLGTDNLSSSATSINITLSANNQPTFVDGVAKLAIYAENKNLNAFPVLGKPAIVEVYDAVAFGLQANSISEFATEYADKTADDITEATYVTFQTPTDQRENYAIIAIAEKYIAIRDCSEGTPNKVILAKADNFMETTNKTAANQMSYRYKYHVTVTRSRDDWTSYFREIQTGDGINQLTGRPIFDNGNWIIDVNDAWEIFYSNAKHQSDGVPEYAEELEMLTTPTIVTDASETNLNQLIGFNGVSIAKDNFRIGDTEVTLSWRYLSSTEKTAADKALIANSDESATFNVDGILMRGENNSLVLEILNLSTDFDRILAVCSHDNHDSYYANQEFAATDKHVMVKGVEIANEGASYAMKLKSNLPLVWESMSEFATTHKAAIDNALTNDPTATFTLNGFIIDKDGSPAFDVISIEPADGEVEIRMTVNSGVLFDEFRTYSLPDFSSSVNFYKPLPDDGSYNIFYRVAILASAEPTDDEVRQALDKETWIALNDENRPKYDCNYWIEAITCIPGSKSTTLAPMLMKKSSIEATSLADMIEAMPETSNNPFFHYRNQLRVLAANPATNYMILSDGTTVIGAVSDFDEYTLPKEIVEGAYIDEIAMTGNRLRDNYFTLSVTDAHNPLKAVEPTAEIKLPELKVLDAELAAETGDYVKIPMAEIKADDDNYMISFVNGTKSMPIMSHLGFDPSTVTDDDQYIVTGYMIPQSKGILIPQAEGAETPLELWATSVEVRRRTATPVFALVGQESNEDGVAVTTEKVTVTITSEEGAAIEYSLDGETWLPYTAPLTVEKSEQISARAVLGDYRESRIAQQTIRFEYYSGDVRITVSDPMPGYTEVRMTPADASLADGSYTIRYTTDGTEPTATSTAYTAPLELEAATTIKAALFENAKERQGKTAQQTVGSIKSGNVKVSVVNDDKGTHVVLAPESNKHLASHFDIFYAFEGGDGTWSRYSAFIHIDEDCKLMAYMVETGKTDGDIVTVAVTGIAKVGVDDAASVSVSGDSIVAPEGSQVFDLTGRRVRPEGLRAGIYIVRLPGGKAVKVAVK